MTRQDDPYRLQELAARQEKARAMGGQRHIERQHGRQRLLDAGTFDELGQLAPIFLGKLYGQRPRPS